jgi:lysozyme
VAARKKKGNFLFVVLWLALIAAMGFIFFLAYLWYEAEEMKFATYPEFGIPIPYEYEIHGIDVSRYQNKIRWKSVKDMRVRHVKLGFAFIKATEGIDNYDPFFKRNWKESKEAGIVRGAYHFFIASKNAKRQALNFTSRVKLQAGDLPPVLDVENSLGLTPEQVRASVKEWLQYVEGYYGVRPIIYTYLDFYKKNLQGHFEDYPLWVAHYLQQHQPRISREWSFWQHSEQGRVNGINSKVDFNVFNGDSIAFRAMLLPDSL